MNISKKIVLIGHFGVGKSSLIRRFVQDIFSEEYKVTIGVQIYKKDIAINDANLTYIIWDIEGKDEIDKIRKSYLLGTSGFIYVIDPTRNSTYVNFNNEVDYIKANFPTAALITVVSKSDLINEKDFIAELSKADIKIDLFSSAKTGKNVQKIFEQLGLNFI